VFLQGALTWEAMVPAVFFKVSDARVLRDPPMRGSFPNPDFPKIPVESDEFL